MKRLLTIFSILGLLLAGAACTNGTNTTVSTNSTANSAPTSATTYTVAQVATHNSSTDCWLVISDTVYDVTAYLPSHPRGASAVVPYCGDADATTGYDTKGGQGQEHSGMADADLLAYKIGTLAN